LGHTLLGHIVRDEGGAMKKFLILLGIIGLVVAVAMYMRSRQGELEY
jgi:hypothetical protein